MGLFSKAPDLSAYKVAASFSGPKFEYEGETYDLDEYVKAREMDLRLKLNSDHTKTAKNFKKAEKAFIKSKNAVTYIEYSIAQQLLGGAEKVKVKAIDVTNNLN